MIQASQQASERASDPSISQLTAATTKVSNDFKVEMNSIFLKSTIRSESNLDGFRVPEFMIELEHPILTQSFEKISMHTHTYNRVCTYPVGIVIIRAI